MAQEETPSEATESSPSDDGAETSTNVQTLTDLFDQLDRAAFKRMLDYRDSFRRSAEKRSKSG